MQQLSREMHLGPKIRKAQLPVMWEQAVGPRVAEVSTPIRMENGKLFVRVANSAWRQELSLMRQEILRQVQSQMNDGPVTELVFL